MTTHRPEHGPGPDIEGTTATICAIVINYYGAELTAKCINSISDEPLDTILLVDNSADDRQRAAMQTIVEETRSGGQTANFVQINSEKNLGFGRAINRAIHHDIQLTGGHSHYLLLNNDTVVTPGLITDLLEAAHVEPALALISPKIEWGSGEVCYYWYQPFLGHVSRRPFPGSFPYVSGCCLLVDAALLTGDSLFDERFFMYGEDVWLTAKAMKAGRAISCVESHTVWHEGSASSRIGSFFYEYHVALGHILLVTSLSDSWHTRLLMILGRTAYLPARALLRALRSRNMIPIKALGAAAWTSLTSRTRAG